ncbi:hypothetical protein QUB80_00725 [Chlorogloeopsis sp. ULAP01]|uniref:hypothetical protein n=1 Tax=Chlorogloeopsis sp. ULAP01 TaxID=3056483 RepID=UPI0025AA6D57|nr:hypothetical protein [Chlorogloeopsis sp. ULAP01]MDM9379232.1 hypothetical protein [Chlorogloeopsis sp. ULAP01]
MPLAITLLCLVASTWLESPDELYYFGFWILRQAQYKFSILDWKLPSVSGLGKSICP